MRLFVEIADRAVADRNLQLVLKMILNPIVWDQLVLGHVHRVDLDPDTVLHRPDDPFRKWRDIAFAVAVFQDLCFPFGNDSTDVKIDDLAGLVSGLPVLAMRQRCSISEVIRTCFFGE